LIFPFRLAYTGSHIDDNRSSPSDYEVKPILVSTVIVFLLLDMIISTFSDIVQREALVTRFEIVLFVAIALIAYGIGQYLLFRFARRVTKDIRSKIPFLPK
jgi:drug/metabolite transporter (DMT)-like permease